MTDHDETDTRELAREIRDLGERIRRLDIELAPFNRREAWIKTALKQTHAYVRDGDAPPRMFGSNHDGVQVAGLNLTPAAVEQRAPLFSELDRVAHIAGPIREARRVARIEQKSLQATLERILKARERSTSRKPAD